MTKKNNEFEKSLARLKEISEKIENNELDFEDSIDLFEEGMKLTKKCRSILNESEFKVQKIINVESSEELEDFELES